MDIIIGMGLLILVLAGFSIFSLKMPKGMKAMGALADAAVASFLVEAFHFYVGGNLFGIDFLGQVGSAAGGMGGVAAATLVPLALGVTPVYAMLVGAACSGMSILPGFFAGYILSFIIPKLEKKCPPGLDLIAVILIAAPLARFIAVESTPIVDGTLYTIGQVITGLTTASPVIMGFVLGGVITVVATAPLSSMALTAMLGLTGTPMAIGALSVMGSSFMNGVLFHKLKMGDKKTVMSVAIEPLTQADLVTANAIPVFATNFIGGGLMGIIVSLSGLINNAPGTATPIAGLAVMYGFNDPIKVTVVALMCAAVGAASGYAGSKVFKNYKIRTAEQILKSQENKKEVAA